MLAGEVSSLGHRSFRRTCKLVTCGDRFGSAATTVQPSMMWPMAVWGAGAANPVTPHTTGASDTTQSHLLTDHLAGASGILTT